VKLSLSLACVAVTLGISACGGDPCLAGKSVFTGQSPAQCSAPTAGNPVGTLQPGQKVVAYAINGTASVATVYYRHAGGSLSQASGVSLPWTFQYVASSGETLYVSAYNDGAAATITAAILVDGVTVKANTATGSVANAKAESTCC
jgi:hypothetical protein